MSLPSEEQWRAVPGYEGQYEVSDHGRVRSLPRTFIRKDGRRYSRDGQIRKTPQDSGGHAQVQLHRDDQPETHLVHRLVLRAFTGEPGPGLVGCHNDGDPTNNRLENLRWDTSLSNNLDTVRHGRHYQANQTHCKRDHEFTPENTRVYNGARSCRTCFRMHKRNHLIRKRALMTERNWPAYNGGK